MGRKLYPIMGDGIHTNRFVMYPSATWFRNSMQYIMPPGISGDTVCVHARYLGQPGVAIIMGFSNSHVEKTLELPWQYAENAMVHIGRKLADWHLPEAYGITDADILVCSDESFNAKNENKIVVFLKDIPKGLHIFCGQISSYVYGMQVDESDAYVAMFDRIEGRHRPLVTVSNFINRFDRVTLYSGNGGKISGGSWDLRHYTEYPVKDACIDLRCCHAYVRIG